MKKYIKTIILIVIIILIGGLIFWISKKPMPTLDATSVNIETPKANVSAITWPANGQSAIGVKGYGVVATNGEQKGVPIASIAKTMLALSVLQKKPLAMGEQGPQVNFTQSDIDKYNDFLAQNQSVVPIAIDEPITEYQALQALMLPSGNNIADALAAWAFGSVNNYLDFANEQAKSWGLTETHFADASGFSPKTVSSAQDLVMLGEHVYDEPVLADVVSQSEVTLPVAGTVYNVNTLLGQENIIGIKTGNTDEAGGCFLFATKNNIDGQDVTIISAILGDTDLATVLYDSLVFAQNNSQSLELLNIITKDQVVGQFDVPWKNSVNVISEEDVAIMSAKGSEINIDTNINQVNHAMKKGDKVGEITIKSANATKIVPLVLADPIPAPSFFWKLSNLFNK